MSNSHATLRFRIIIAMTMIIKMNKRSENKTFVLELKCAQVILSVIVRNA